MKNKIMIVILFLSMLPFIYADCSVTKKLNNVTVYDFIEPSGRGSDCVVSLLQNGYLFQKENMTGNDLYYSANFSNLNYAKEYRAFIECNVSTIYYYSECYFTITGEIGSAQGEEQPIVVNLAYPYYMDVDETEYIVLYSTNMSGQNATIEIDGNTYSMDNTSTYWFLGLTSAIEEDVNFTIFINDSVTTEPLYNKTGILRFRIPFYVDFKFYQDGDGANSSTADPYLNDFQYLFLVPTTKIGKTWLDLNSETDWFSWVDPILYKLMGVSYTPKGIDKQLAFWSNYEGGGSKVKLYEGGNYSVNLEITKAKNSLGWNYEFVYPQFTGSEYYNEIISLEIIDEVDQTYEIYIDKLELNTFKFMMNILWFTFLIVMYVGIVILVACLSQDLKVTIITAIAFLIILLILIAMT